MSKNARPSSCKILKSQKILKYNKMLKMWNNFAKCCKSRKNFEKIKEFCES